MPVLLGAAFAQTAPIVALHLTRPEIEIPDRAALGMPSHFEAARGAYVLREYLPGAAAWRHAHRAGHQRRWPGWSKYCPSWTRARPERQGGVRHAARSCLPCSPGSTGNGLSPPADRLDSTVITTMARGLMDDWLFNPLAEEYALSSDWDDRWRTGGTVDEVLDEAHLSPEWLLKGIERFVNTRPQRLTALQDDLRAAMVG